MKRTKLILLTCIAMLTIPATGWSKGRTTKIVIVGDGLSTPIEITNPNIVSQFNIWNGPGVSTRNSDGVLNPLAYLNPNRSAGRFIDWPKGIVPERSPGLQRLEVTFYIGDSQLPDEARKYDFAYEVDSSNKRGYIYLPRWKNSLISHNVEGNWFFASERWDDLVMPIVTPVVPLSSISERGRLNCSIGTGLITNDGTIEFSLQDENGNKRGRYRYETTTERYSSVKAHIGELVPGEETNISCWPARS